jgi:four helix bundle protein
MLRADALSSRRSDHRQFKVWQLAQAITESIWTATLADHMPRLSHTVRQIRASAESVGANIAEGNGRSPKAFRRYLNIAMGSANETDSHLETLRYRGQFDAAVGLRLRDELATVKRMILALQKTLS